MLAFSNDYYGLIFRATQTLKNFDYLYVELYTFIETFCIQADDFFKVCDVASAADLPHSGDSRLDGDSGTVVQLILFQLIGEDRAGSHKAHGAS